MKTLALELLERWYDLGQFICDLKVDPITSKKILHKEYEDYKKKIEVTTKSEIALRFWNQLEQIVINEIGECENLSILITDEMEAFRIEFIREIIKYLNGQRGQPKL